MKGLVAGFIVGISILLILMRHGYIVFDRAVFDFQINPILNKGRIDNLRDYRVVHNYIEQTFEKDPDLMENNPKIDLCNEMMGDFHENS